ncbi:MAG: hypothetical protein J3K34DRAFT_285356 [Monoraphidium minutum]|nr:MAG: hypothetical protein J3K34DRAFT_285356 [Monoraphidium minutum]
MFLHVGGLPGPHPRRQWLAPAAAHPPTPRRMPAPAPRSSTAPCARLWRSAREPHRRYSKRRRSHLSRTRAAPPPRAPAPADALRAVRSFWAPALGPLGMTVRAGLSPPFAAPCNRCHPPPARPHVPRRGWATRRNRALARAPLAPASQLFSSGEPKLPPPPPRHRLRLLRGTLAHRRPVWGARTQRGPPSLPCVAGRRAAAPPPMHRTCAVALKRECATPEVIR